MRRIVSLIGCEKIDREVDWAPVSLFLRVVDGKGADLLDPENPNNLIDGTCITFKGNTYNACRQWYETWTKTWW